MKFLVFGLGALGTVFATCLKARGVETYGFVKKEKLNVYKNNVFKITGIFGDREAVLDGILSEPLEARKVKPDVVLLTVKSFDTEKAVKQIKEFLPQNGLVILAQNGYGNYETAIKYLDKSQVLLARVIFGARVVSPCFAEVTVIADDVVIGQPEGAVPEEIQKQIANALNEAGIPTRVSKDVYKILWDKILYNSALNPLGAILECNYGTLAENEETREIMNEVVREIFKVTKALKIELNWKSAEEYLKHFYEKLVPPTAKHFPSMYHDIALGKKTEIDALNGAIVKLAKKAGLTTPVNEVITNLVKVKEKLKLRN